MRVEQGVGAGGAGVASAAQVSSVVAALARTGLTCARLAAPCTHVQWATAGQTIRPLRRSVARPSAGLGELTVSPRWR
jgi:hypothetical protein